MTTPGTETPSLRMRSFDQSLPMALLQAREAAMRLFRPLLAAHQLTEQQWRVLRALAAESPRDVGQIADATFLLGPSLTRILSNLEHRSLVSRSPVASDQRRASIALTDRGFTLVAGIAPSSEAIYQQIEQSFGADRLAALLRELSALRDSAAAAQ